MPIKNRTAHQWRIWNKDRKAFTGMVWDSLDSARDALYDWQQDCPTDDFTLKRRVVTYSEWMEADDDAEGPYHEAIAIYKDDYKGRDGDPEYY